MELRQERSPEAVSQQGSVSADAHSTEKQPISSSGNASGHCPLEGRSQAFESLALMCCDQLKHHLKA